ncbi:MAG: LPS export ABC transporter periplasmic protein LptC [Sulfurimonas sp.]|nr:LPS export ABC transporter periplasmic protein LptC [Sulfurimonas sp.]MDQ7061496.1 LPS export ABC transporter periplasmic protein LptC [Sulfurimonas sp.]
MNINLFFLFLIAGLSIIFFLFQPIQHIKKKATEIPTLELENFKLSELDTNGLTSIMNGKTGKKFLDRYVITNIDYTDNTNKYIANIRSNNALYKSDILHLDGDIKYFREDGLNFLTQKASYNKKTSVMISLTDYKSQMNQNTVTGSYFEYNNATGITRSKNVKINYQLKERK